MILHLTDSPAGLGAVVLVALGLGVFVAVDCLGLGVFVGFGLDVAVALGFSPVVRDFFT